jgi:hypothetical protein
MKLNLHRELVLMQKMTTKELKRKYADLFEEMVNTNNRTWLIRRIAWRLQANEYGGLSERARARAEEIADDADLRVTAPKDSTPEPAPVRTVSRTLASDGNGDDRLPPAGTVLTRQYKGQTLKVLVLADGFEFEGERFKSLSALAKSITGSHVNGYAFFQLNKGGTR